MDDVPVGALCPDCGSGRRDATVSPPTIEAVAHVFPPTVWSGDTGDTGAMMVAIGQATEVDVAMDIAPLMASQPDTDERGGDDGSKTQRRARAEQDFASLGLGGARQGAARYSLLNIPEPVAAADADFNRSITLDEFRTAALARFQLLDTARQGRLSLAQLEAIPHVPNAGDKRLKINDNASDTRIGNPLPKGP